MVKLIHCADIHLDTPFRSATPEASAEGRRGLRRALSRLVEYARAEGVSAVLMAGDVFDSATVTSDTVAFFKDTVSALPECIFAIAPGNHDPSVEKGVWDALAGVKNIHIFSKSEMEHIDLEGKNVRIYGYGFTSSTLESSPMIGFKPEDSGKVNILVAHAHVGDPLSPHCPVSEGDIEASGFDYCAFGHIHAREGVKYAGKTPYAYSGCLVGRDFGETGEKGAITVTVSDDGVLTFGEVSFTDRTYEISTLDVSGALDTAELRRRIVSRVSEYSPTVSLRIILSGQLPLELNVDTVGLSAELSSGVAYLEIEDNTVPTLDAATLEADPTIIGELYRELKPILENGTAKERTAAARALRIGIAALKGEDIPL